jgi:hypothetical protein
VLSEVGSLIVPVERALLDALAPDGAGLPEELALGRVRLARKAEHHVTVLGFAVGRLLLKVIAARPELRAEIDALAAAHDWAIRPRDAYVHVVQDTPGRPRLQTIIALADATLEAFYGRLREHLAGLALPGSEPLLAALAAAPPPHVTLYTSDLLGKAAIGLKHAAELESAVGHGRDGAAEGLRAYPLSPEVVRGAEAGAAEPQAEPARTRPE